MDLKKARAEGISFVTHKLIETAPGQVFKHRKVGQFISLARAAGMLNYGAYIVPRTGVSVTEQVNNALAYADQQIPGWKADPRFFWQVDLEKWPYDAVPASVGFAMATQLLSRTGKKVALYASRGQYSSSVPRGFPLWNANYAPEHAPTRAFKQVYVGVGGDNGPGWAPYSGQVPAIWQYASDTRIGNIQPADANAFRGTQAQFDALFASPVAARPPVVVPTPPKAEQYPTSLATTADFSYAYQVVVEIGKLAPYALPVTDTTRALNGPIAKGHWDYHVGNAAVDFGTRDASKVARQANIKFWDALGPSLTEAIHSTPYADDNGLYWKNGKRVSAQYYAEPGLHLSHFHIAIADKNVAVTVLNRLLMASKTHVYVKGVGVVNVKEFADAVWSHLEPDAAGKNKQTRVADLLRYARVDAYTQPSKSEARLQAEIDKLQADVAAIKAKLGA